MHIDGLKALCSAKNSKQATSKTRFTNKKRGPFKLCTIKFYYLVFPPCDLESEGSLTGTLLTKLHNVREDLHQVWQRSLAKLHRVREKIITLVSWMLITTKDQRVFLVPIGHIKILGNKMWNSRSCVIVHNSNRDSTRSKQMYLQLAKSIDTCLF